MKVATIDNVKVGDEVWVKARINRIDNKLPFPLCTTMGAFLDDGRLDSRDSEPSLFISEPTIHLDIPESKLEAVKKLLAE